LPTATIDFTAATTAIGQSVLDVQTFVLAQAFSLFTYGAVVGAVLLVVGLILRWAGLRKKSISGAR